MRDRRPATSGGEYADAGSRSDGVAHAGYTELKVHSGSESDFLFTDDDAFLQMTDFNVVEPPERRVRKSRSRTSFEDKKTPKRKQDVQDNKDKKKDYKNVGSPMHERKIVDKTQDQPPVPIGEHASVIFELITMSEARPFSLDLPKDDNAGEVTHKGKFTLLEIYCILRTKTVKYLKPTKTLENKTKNLKSKLISSLSF